MILIRLLVMAFNAAVIGFLIFEMIRISRLPIDRTKKRLVIIGGIILLLAPLGIFLRFFPASPQYFLIYPLAIALYIYLIRNV